MFINSKFFENNLLVITLCISLIFSEYYFFNWNSRVLISHSYLIFNTIFLFIFSVIFFLSFFNILKKLKNYLSKKSLKIVNILFFSFIYFKIFQIPFFLANTIQLKGLFVILLKKILLKEMFFLIIFLKILVPFLLTFLLIYFIIEKNFKFLINFIISFSIIFSFFMFFDVLKRVKYIDEYEIKFSNQNNNRQVLWIIFDEYDPEYIAKNKFDLNLKNINNIKNYSVIHNKHYSPASATLHSVPSTLMKIKMKGSIIENYQVKLLDQNNKKINFELNNTLFKDLIDENLSFEIYSEVLPYCNLFKLNQNCEKKFNQFKYYFDAIINNFTPMNYFYYFRELLLKRDKFEVNNLNSFDNLNNQNLFLSKKLNISIENFSKILNKQTNLIFFHLFLPHIDYGGDDPVSTRHIRDHFNMNPENIDQEYLLNLKYVDLLINEIFDKIKKTENKDILVILTSDHWRRKDSPNYPKPSLFLAKIKKDNSKKEMFTENVNTFIPDLILKYLKKDIKSHNDIKLFFDSLPKFNINEVYINR